MHLLGLLRSSLFKQKRKRPNSTYHPRWPRTMSQRRRRQIMGATAADIWNLWNRPIMDQVVPFLTFFHRECCLSHIQSANLWCFSRFCSRSPSVHSLHLPTQQANFLIHCRSSSLHHLYADDTRLLVSCSPHSLPDTLNHIRSTITQISAWMTNHSHKPPVPKPIQNRNPLYCPALVAHHHIFLYLALQFHPTCISSSATAP